MLFSYPLTDEHNLNIDYNSSLKEAKVNLDNENIFEFTDYSHMIRGDEFDVKGVGLVYLKFINEADGFEIKIGSRHHDLSATHPKKKMKKLAAPTAVGFIPTTLAFIVLLVLWNQIRGSNQLQVFNTGVLIVSVYHILAISGIILAVILARRGKWQGLIIGLSVYGVHLILKLVLYFMGFYGPNIITILFFLLEIAIFIYLVKNISLINILRHQESGNDHDTLVLDDQEN